MEFTECDEKFASEILKYRGDPRSIFKLLEDDGDGELSWRELKNAAERILKVHISDEEAEEMFADADWDGGGDSEKSVSYKTFQDLYDLTMSMTV